MTYRIQLGQMLVQAGRIDEFQLRSALAHQARWGGEIGDAIIALGFMPEKEVLQAQARQLGVDFVQIGDLCVDPVILRRVPEKLARARKVFPIAIASTTRRGPLVVATSNPHDLHALDEVAFASGLKVKAVLASASDVERAIERHWGTGSPGWGQSAVELPPAVMEPMRVVPFAHNIN